MKRLLAERGDEPAPAESRLERKLWGLIVRSGLPRPVRQHRVCDGRGFVARVDLAYPEVLLAVEADGYRWHSGRRAWSRDLARRNRLTSLGWRVLHVTHYDVTESPDDVVEQIRLALADRTLSLQPRSTTVAGQTSA
ncbi:MAG: endonuclease domain-containing protein [Actinomycetota bacterium]|nr:endonuclease domain-containing protein [Actinomycetota bacterium]